MLHHLAAFTFCLLVATSATVFPAVAETGGTGDSAEALARHASDLFLHGHCATALAEFDRALADGIDDATTLYRAAICQQRSSKPLALVRKTMARAVEKLDGVVNLHPETATLTDYAFLSSAYRVIGDPVTARKTAAAGVAAYRGGKFGDLDALPPVEAYHLGQLGEATASVDLQAAGYGRFVKSDEATGRPAQQGPALARLGQIALQQGRFEEARDSLSRALEIMPSAQMPGARFDLAVSLFRLRRYQEADEAFNAVRAEDPLRESQAGYARLAMRTLAVSDRLLDKNNPLPDLADFGQAELEQRMIQIGTEMAEAGAGLPAAALQRGHLGRKAGPEKREAMHRVRDLKVRLAQTAAEYAARGYQLREFAFSQGLQGSLRPWTHMAPRRAPVGDEKLELPSFVGDETRQRYEEDLARAAARKEKGAARKAAGKQPGHAGGAHRKNKANGEKDSTPPPPPPPGADGIQPH
ncbi:MAG: tetratricopeptide repeat protein [Acidobacteriota bacterium]